MSKDKQLQQPIAVIGAGPAGLYAAKELAAQGAQVALINRDIKPGGLAEYGIFHSKHKMKTGLRKQFQRVLQAPNIHYYGNLVVGEQGDLTLDDLRQMGFAAALVTVGAQGTKWLGLDGEDLDGVYHAKDLVYHYNQLPPFSEQPHPVGERVVIIGVGNVMMDIANYCIRDKKVKSVTAIARRGLADVKFSKVEMQHLFNNLDLAALNAEVERTAPVLQAVGQDIEAAKEFILSAQARADQAISDTVFRLEFLASPKAMYGSADGQLTALELDETSLEMRPDGQSTKAVRLGTTRMIECDTVVFCIGDRVDASFGLPLDQWGEFAKSPQPCYPVDEISYEAYDLDKQQPVRDVFLAGWAREASSGLVGTARKDGTNGARALAQYAATLSPASDPTTPLEALAQRIAQLDKPVIGKQHWFKLSEIEAEKAEAQGLLSFKFDSNDEMLAALGLLSNLVMT